MSAYTGGSELHDANGVEITSSNNDGEGNNSLRIEHYHSPTVSVDEDDNYYSRTLDEMMEAHLQEMDDEIQRSLDNEMQSAIQKQMDEFLDAERETLYAVYEDEVDGLMENELFVGDIADLAREMQQLLHLSRKPKAFVGVKPSFADINAQVQDIVVNYQAALDK
jgi:hypothetical protein